MSYHLIKTKLRNQPWLSLNEAKPAGQAMHYVKQRYVTYVPKYLFKY